MKDTAPKIDAIVDSILASPKNKHLPRQFVEYVVSREFTKHPNSSDEIGKAAKRKIHQVVGAYQRTNPRYSAWLKELQNLGTSNEVATKAFCLDCMSSHASTYERLPILEEFYAIITKRFGTGLRILDLACGLNPLALPWMGSPPPTRYIAADLDQQMIDFLNKFFSRIGFNAEAISQDVCAALPEETFDLALLLKALPPLAQLVPEIEEALLAKIPANNLVITFPTVSLGGKNKGMLQNYAARFESLPGLAQFSFEKVAMSGELVYFLERR